MKILHVVPTYLPAYRYGGPIKSVHELNKWLVKNGVQVTVYTTNIDGSDDLKVEVNKPIDIDGVKVYYFKSGFFRFWFYSGALRRALVKNLNDFDLIHITSVFLSASALGGYYARKFKKPYIISPRGSLMIEALNKKQAKKRIYLSAIENKNLENASAIHFTTDLEKEEYLKLNLPLKKSAVISNGLDTNEFEEKIPIGYFREKYKVGSEKKIVLFLGRLSWKKGIDTLIPSFAELAEKNKDVILVLAGGDDENYKKIIDDLIDKYRIKDKIVFCGMISGKDKIAAYQDSNVFVLPSYAENFGIAPVEAMYFGLPIIITDKVGIAPMVLKIKSGIVIKKDKDELTSSMFKIFNDYKFANELGENGKKMAREEFDWQKIAENFIRLYNELIPR